MFQHVTTWKTSWNMFFRKLFSSHYLSPNFMLLIKQFFAFSSMVKMIWILILLKSFGHGIESCVKLSFIFKLIMRWLKIDFMIASAERWMTWKGMVIRTWWDTKGFQKKTQKNLRFVRIFTRSRWPFSSRHPAFIRSKHKVDFQSSHR